MIPNYIRPQHRIFQLLDVTPDAPADRINALVMGPTYFVNRYGQETIPAQSYDAAGTTLDYLWYDSLEQSQLLSATDYELDTDSVRVWIENAEAVLANMTADVTLDADRKTLTSDTNDFSGSGTLRADLDGRPVQVGDLVDVYVDGVVAPFRRTVTSLTTTTLVLNLAVPGTEALDRVEIVLVHSGEVDSDLVTAGAATVALDPVALEGTGVGTAPALKDEVGSVYVQFRALMAPPADEEILSIRNQEDIEQLLGTIAIENDLAWAATRALSGSGGKRIYALRTNGDDLTAFNTALVKISATDMVYALAPITSDREAQNAVSAHVDAQSQPDVKNFRRCYLGFDSPGQTVVIDTITFTAAAFGGSANRYITVSAGGLIAAGVRAGYVFTSGSVNYTIQERVSDTEFILEGAGPASGSGASISVPDTADGQKDLLIERGRSLTSRRSSIVWVHKGSAWVDGRFQTVPNRFLAAEIAGLRSALLPQQGLTRTEVTTIASAPLMYVLFSQDQLDEIAANGVFIVTQDVESGTVYIRHQITTETDKGSLYYEDSLGTNLDAICFQVKDAVEGFIGKRNVTPGTVSEIRGLVRDILQAATETDEGVDSGPQLISYQDLVVEAHPQLKDRISIRFTGDFPLPLNNIDTYARASVGLTI